MVDLFQEVGEAVDRLLHAALLVKNEPGRRKSTLLGASRTANGSRSELGDDTTGIIVGHRWGTTGVSRAQRHEALPKSRRDL